MMMQHTLTQLHDLARWHGAPRGTSHPGMIAALTSRSVSPCWWIVRRRGDSRRLERLLRQAKLKHGNACLSMWTIALPRRGQALIATLAPAIGCARRTTSFIERIRARLVSLRFGPERLSPGFSAQYLRVPRLFEEMRIAHADGSFSRKLAALARTDLIVLDDWGLAVPGAPERGDLLEILDDRVGVKSTIVTSQLPLDQWHTYLGDPTLADAILDRLVHAAHRITLKGESMRKKDKI